MPEFQRGRCDDERMRVHRRAPRAWVALSFRAVSLLLLVVGVAGLAHHPVVATVAVGVGLAVLPLAWRRKGPVARDAVFTASADRLLPNGSHRPGQLSITPTALAWTPSGWSVRHGQQSIDLDARECKAISLERGVALRDLVLEITPVDGEAIRLLTHANRQLQTAIDGLDDRRAGAAASSRRSAPDELG